MVIVNFIRDPEVGIFARAKRLSKEAKAKLGEVEQSKAGSRSDSDGEGR